MASGQVGQYQIGSFVSPVNGGPLDATVVRGNDNAIVGVHDNHDNDPTIHVQSFPFASLPSASTLGRFLIASDTQRAYFDTGSVLQEIAYLSKAGGTLTGPITAPGVNRLTGTGNTGTTVAAWRFGDNNSGSSRDWVISNGYAVGAAAIGALVFAHSAAANGDPILNTATEVLRLNSSGLAITGAATVAGLVQPSLTATFDLGTNGTRWNSLYLAAGIVAAGSATFGSTVTASGFTGDVTGNVSGSSGSTTGNAGTATKLQTARTINGVSFDGTANITVASAAGTLTGATLASGVTASSLTSLGTLSALAVNGVTTLTGSGGSDALTIVTGNLSLSAGALNVAATATISGNATGNLILPHRTAPVIPADGAIWTTTSGMFVRINGVTKTVTLT